MRRFAIIVALLLLLIQPRAADAPRGVIGLFGEQVSTTVHPSSTAVPARKHDLAARAVKLPAVTLSSVFAARAPSLAGLDPRRLITIRTTGDVIPARMVNEVMTERNDFTYPFLKTYKYTRAADLTLINLESPLIPGCQPTETGMTFCGDQRAVQGLRLAGVDIANLPNNHIGNYGDDGIRATEKLLAANDIAWDGFGHTVYKNVKGVVFAFLGFNAVEQEVDTKEMEREIRGARKRANVVIVSMHWGMEYTPLPQVAPGVADQDPRVLAHLAVDAGADLIVGNHPHVVQGVEIYKGKFISYASGNFVFDQISLGRSDTQQGVVGTYTFYGKKLVSVRYRPVLIADWAQPHFISAKAEAPILRRMLDASLTIKKGY